MKLGNTLSDYSPVEIELMGNRIESWLETLRESDQKMMNEVKSPTERDEGCVIIHVDFHPFTQFNQLKDEVLPLHMIIDHYDRWNDVLWEQITLNIGNFKNPTVLAYVMKLRSLVATFQQFFGTPEAPPPRAAN